MILSRHFVACCLVSSGYQWRALRDDFRRQADIWHKAVATRTEWDDMSAAGALSSAAHTAYHPGAIRQILAALKHSAR